MIYVQILPCTDTACSDSPWDAVYNLQLTFCCILGIPSIGYSFLERYFRMDSMRFCSSRSWRLLIRLAHVALPVFFHCHCNRILCILSFGFLQESSFSISKLTFPSMRRQAPTEAKELPSRAIIWLMWSKSRSWHCNSANLLHASSLNIGGRSSSSVITDWLATPRCMGHSKKCLVARVLSQLHAFHPRTCHAHSWHACWSKHFLDTLDCLHGSQTNPYCMGAPRKGSKLAVYQIVRLTPFTWMGREKTATAWSK